MSPKSACIAVVQIGDWFAELRLQLAANVEPCPVAMHEVRRTLGAEYTRGARRSGRVEPDDSDIVQSHTRSCNRHLQSFGNLLEANLRSFLGPSWMLA